MKKWQRLGLAVAIGLSFLLVSVPTHAADKTIRLGSSPGPYSELFLKGIKPILEKEGYTVKNTSFSDLLQADIALSQGQLDLSVDQHTAYMDNFNENKKADLAAFTPIPTVPTAIFPGERKTLKAVKNGDKIGIPNDPANTARAYRLLEKAGWIKLRKGVDPLQATKSDIAKNPHHLKFMEMDSAQIPRNLQDLAYGVVPGSIAYSAKLKPSASLLHENVVKQYELVAVTTKEKQNQPWVKAVKKAYRSKAFKQYLKKHNTNDYWFVPKELK